MPCVSRFLQREISSSCFFQKQSPATAIKMENGVAQIKRADSVYFGAPARPSATGQGAKSHRLSPPMIPGIIAQRGICDLGDSEHYDPIILILMLLSISML
jgi:hypothetical protein